MRARSRTTQIVVSYRADQLSRTQARTALGYAVRSLDTYSAAFGTFPYPEMDVVLTGFTAFGGMEYPTIIFTNRGKITISHELAHQYFYGIVGDDQYQAPWLDESFATWVSYLPFGGWKKCAYFRWPSDTARITNDMAYWADHLTEYYTIYSGGGCLLANLADRFGLDRFVEILHDYAQDHWLGVTRTADFKAAVEVAALADGLDFDPATYWTHWRVD
jgi:aminopeptidase N